MKEQFIEELLAKAALGDLSPEESGRLVEACEADKELRRRLMRLIQVERMTGLALEGNADIFSQEFCFRVEAEVDDGFSAKVASRLKKNKILKWAAGWGAAAAAVVLSFFFLMGNEVGVVAKIVRIEASDLLSEDLNLEVGERIIFEEGLVEVYFKTGVRVVLEAPVYFEITGENESFLHYGKLVAEVNDETAHGFVVDGPSGRLVDLGTSFAVAVDKGGAMEVHVIEGLVDATANGGVTSRLEKDQAMILSGGQAARMDADLGKFVVRMPDYHDSPPRFVRWGFDVRADSVVAETGSGFGMGKTEGNLKSFSGNGVGPTRVNGPFGKGLKFDGNDSFFVSDFPGITGSQPRTVAFWVKVPQDFDHKEGYGMINWGDLRVGGGAWQISANGTELDGPLGRLRIGTQFGQVIGTTDLRDEEWHHCAVVLYGDEEGKPNTATHVLLYVDGKLEPAARKSMQVVDTVALPKSEEGSHGVWMGRNLGFEHEGSSGAWEYGRFFRGEIDEMVICDMAMNQAQILRLMRENEMPE